MARFGLNNMTEAYMEIREENFMTSADPDAGFEGALATYVRRHSMSIKDIQNQWNLTDGEARGVLYGQASRGTLRKIVKAGGWDIGLALLTGVIGHDLTHHIEKRRAHERAQFERIDSGLRKMAADLPVVLGVGDAGRH